MHNLAVGTTFLTVSAFPDPERKILSTQCREFSESFSPHFWRAWVGERGSNLGKWGQKNTKTAKNKLNIYFYRIRTEEFLYTTGISRAIGEARFKNIAIHPRPLWGPRFTPKLSTFFERLFSSFADHLGHL